MYKIKGIENIYITAQHIFKKVIMLALVGPPEITVGPRGNSLLDFSRFLQVLSWYHSRREWRFPLWRQSDSFSGTRMHGQTDPSRAFFRSLTAGFLSWFFWLWVQRHRRLSCLARSGSWLNTKQEYQICIVSQGYLCTEIDFLDLSSNAWILIDYKIEKVLNFFWKEEIQNFFISRRLNYSLYHYLNKKVTYNWCVAWLFSLWMTSLGFIHKG